MSKCAALVSVLASCALAVPAWAQAPTPAERTFFNQHISDVVTFEPTLVAAPGRVFAAPFYLVQVNIAGNAGAATTNNLIVAHVGAHLVNVSQPGTDAEMRELASAFSPTFRLATPADAAALQKALDAVYPISDRDDQKVKANRHAGNQWVFIRGVFFDDRRGFIFETDAKGAIVAAKYSLKLPK